MDAGPHQIGGPYVADKAIIRLLAESALFGLPVSRLIQTTNGVERDLLLAIHAEAVNVYDDLQTSLARKIVKEQSDAQQRGAKKKA